MLDQLLTQFLDHLRYERNVSAHTLRNYESDLSQFFNFLAPSKSETEGKSNSKQRSPQNEPNIEQIDHLTIREWLANLHSDHKKKTSIARKLAALRTVFQFLVRLSYICFDFILSKFFKNHVLKSTERKILNSFFSSLYNSISN